MRLSDVSGVKVYDSLEAYREEKRNDGGGQRSR